MIIPSKYEYSLQKRYSMSQNWTFSAFMFTDPPKLVRRSNRTIDSVEGQTVELNCKATGNPVPSMLWTHNGRILPNKATVLRISGIQRSQAGTYNCTATNLAGNVSEGFLVRVVRCKYTKECCWFFPAQDGIEFCYHQIKLEFVLGGQLLGNVRGLSREHRLGLAFGNCTGAVNASSLALVNPEVINILLLPIISIHSPASR